MNTELLEKKSYINDWIYDCLVTDSFILEKNIVITDTSLDDHDITKVVIITNILPHVAINALSRLNNDDFNVLGFTHDNEQSITTITLKV